MTIETKAREWAEKNVRYDNGKSAIQQLEEAYLAGAAEVMRWVPVSERLPEKNTNVLVHYGDKSVLIGQVDASNCWFIFWRDGFLPEEIDLPVTHWMPLPHHPEKEQL